MSNVIRISGLVKFADTVRLEIGRGLSLARKQQLQQSVFRSVSQIDKILAAHYAKPLNLAAPSRRAYQFLTEIRWDAIPQAMGDAPASPPPQGLRWKGLGRFAERLTIRLSSSPLQTEIDEIAASIEKMRRRIELSIQQANVGPEHLTEPTRQWRAWYAFLSERENFNQYVAAVAKARQILEPAAKAVGKPAILFIQFIPSRHIYKWLPHGDHALIVLPTPMTVFDEAALIDLAALIFGRDKQAKRRVTDRMRSEAYTEVATDLEALAGVVEGTRGAFHDLAESFDRVNTRYFAGQMVRPKLTWSRSFTGRKFGHYDTIKDWVMVSSTLDRADVPQFVVDFLMFHELLHKKHGIRWKNGRGHAHTSAFYAEELTFERHAEAEGWLTKLAQR